MRTTKREVEGCFGRLCAVLGKRQATGFDDVGAWRLSYAPCYGGYVVEEITSSRGGTRDPLGSRRRSAAEFCSAVWFAVEAVEVKS